MSAGIVRGGPIAGTGIWQAVTRAAGSRCVCAGVCGRSHTRTEGRCASTTPAVRLYAAPTDPSIPTSAAHRVPIEALSAWCGPCLDGARRRHPAAPTLPPPAPDALFDLPPGAKETT
jgi:hypothetical protein